MAEAAPLNLGFWSQWYTPPPIWVAVPFQKVPDPSLPKSTTPTPGLTGNTGVTAISPNGLTSLTAGYSSYGGERPQLFGPEILVSSGQGNVVSGQGGRNPFTTFNRVVGYSPNTTAFPPYGTAGQAWEPSNTANGNLISYDAVSSFEGSTSSQWAFSWFKGADVSWAGVTEQKKDLSYSCLLTKTSTGPNANMGIASGSTYGFGTLQAGKSYQFDIWLRAKIGTPAVRLELFNQTTAVTTSASYVQATNDWTMRSITITPALTQNYVFTIRFDSSVPVGESIYVDKCEVYRTDIPRTVLNTSVTVPHANRTFQRTFNTNAEFCAAFEGAGYGGFSGRPQYLWDWIQTGTLDPSRPNPGLGGYTGGFGISYTADMATRFLRTGTLGLSWIGAYDMRGRSTDAIYAGFYCYSTYRDFGFTIWGYQTYMGLQSGAQWFDWSGLLDISNWNYFHPSSLLGTTPTINCVYYDKFYWAEAGSPPNANQYVPYRVQFEDENVQLLDSKLIFETTWPVNTTDTTPGSYSESLTSAGPGYFSIFRDAPTPMTYNAPVNNNRGVKVADLIPTHTSGVVTGITWNSAGPGITPYTYQLSETSPALANGYTQFGAEIDIDLLAAYPGHQASFALHSSYEWNDPVNANTFVPTYPVGGPLTSASISTQLKGSFEVLVQVQLPRFRYVIPWGQPSDVDESMFPVRLQQRDDGIGGYQGHSRIRNINGAKSSDADSGRLPGNPNSYR
jgi:hypothetical protein